MTLSPRGALLMLVTLAVTTSGCYSPPKTGNPAVEDRATRKRTERNLDIAIRGEGYFIVQLPTTSGFLFTRRGALSVASSGELVNADGYRLYPPISVADASGLSITPDGLVRVAHSAPELKDLPPEVAGQIVLSRFSNISGLLRDGAYVMPGATTEQPVTGRPGTNGLGTIIVGELEE